MTAFHDERPYGDVLLLGDNVYPDGDPAGLRAKFEAPYGELLRRAVRFHAVLGNHDVERGRDAQIHYKHFNMGGQPYYSFTVADDLVQFFALDSNNVDAAQRRWLEGALSASRARWKVVALHHPLYSSAKRHGSDPALCAALEPLFVRYGVAAVFAGHDHVYERTKLIEGVQYFVSGAGAKLRRGDLDPRSRFFAAGNDVANSFMFLEVTPERFAFWSVDASGRILDAGTLARSATRSEALPAR
jgi:acid phosphatase